MQGIVQFARDANRKTVIAVLAMAVFFMPLAFTKSAGAHSSSWCKHSTLNDDGTHYIVYNGGEWVGGNHYHYYSHYYLIGNFDHNATKQCAH